MSIKDLFGKRSNQIVTQADLDRLEKDIESTEYAEAKVTDNMKFVPRVTADFEDPKTFARYGSAEKYYEDAVATIANTYPYDGSAKEKLEWHNNATYIDNWIFENKYPRTTGYVSLNAADFSGTSTGGITGESPTEFTYREFTNPQYVTIKGGPHPTPDNPTGKLAKQFPEQQGKSNILDSTKSRESNLHVDASKGVTIEFWWKKESTSETGIECLFYLTNGIDIGTTDWARLFIEHDDTYYSAGNKFFYVTQIADAAGANSGIYRLGVGSASELSDYTTTDWNHYAFVIENNSDGVKTDVSLYINGKFIKKESDNNVGTSNQVSTFKYGTGLQASIGAYLSAPGSLSGYPTSTGFGATRGKFDEFRFWKTARTAEEIGRHWFTQVGGGTNTDDSNTDLGVYYKFNEGIVNSTTAINLDAAVLDSSGRLSNGNIVNYNLDVRSTNSAIEEYDSKKKEFKDPILYTSHPSVVSLLADLKSEGNLHDVQNNSAIYHTMPDWILAEDEQDDNKGTLKNLTQVIASYFDTLHLQIEALPKLTNSEYTQDGEKPLPFAKKLLESVGFMAPEIFVDASVLESLLDRNDDILFEDSINNVKNLIYQNIYNNISNIYKSKGTEKSFRNLLRCFGVGDELIKINLYGDNVKFKFENNFKSTTVRKNYLDYYDENRYQATCFQFATPGNSDSTSFIAGSTTNQFDAIPFTLEADIIFPRKISKDDENYKSINFSTSSLFGMHEANPSNEADLTWHGSDVCGFSVQAIRVGDADSTDVKFKLTTTSAWGSAYTLETDIIQGVYDNQRWNFAVSLRPDKYPSGLAAHTGDGTYTLEFYGVNSVLDIVQNEFTVTQSIANANGKAALNAAKRVFSGAEYEDNSSSSTPVKTDVKVGAVRYWLDYLDSDTIKDHARDVTNYGAKRPSRHAYLQTTAGALDMTQADTLALNWDFQTSAVPAGGAGGAATDSFMYIEDVSSGSAAIASDSWLAAALKKQHTGKGHFYLINDTKAVDRNFIFTAKQQLPESISSSDTVNVLSQDDITFTKESRPINHFWAIEKSMYQAISDEMINIFASIADFNNLVGNPVNRYRMDYKELGHLRQMFFDRIQNEPDVEKYIEFYKWLDSSVNTMLQQLIPASANFSDEMRTMIESHVLERNKYWNKFPTYEERTKKAPLIAPAAGGAGSLYEVGSGLATSNESENSLWWKDRAERDNATITSGDADVDAGREQIRRAYTSKVSTKAPVFANPDSTTYQGSTYALRNLTKVYRLQVEKEPTPIDEILPVTITNVGPNPATPAPFGQVHDGTYEENPTNVVTKSLGNYRDIYQVVQTSGRKNNNSWFTQNAGLSSSILTGSESAQVYGHYDFTLEDRTPKKHVFVERFSAPGSADTMQRGMLDVEGEEYSAYNSLNFRNLDVRLKMNDWLTKHFEWDSSGPRENFHKAQRNAKHVHQSDGTCATNYDNFWFQHQIPQSGFQYSWIASSVMSGTGSLQAQDCPQGYATDYLNLAPQHPQIQTDPSSAFYGMATGYSTLSPGFTGALLHLDDDLSNSVPDSDIITSETTPVGITYTTGKFSKSLVCGATTKFFINSSNKAATDDTNSLHWDGEFTVDLWVKFDSSPITAGSNELFWSCKAGGGLPQYTNNRFEIGYLGNGGAFGLPDDAWLLILGPGAGSIFLTAADTIAADTWYHLAVTRDSSNKMRIFRDGVGLAMSQGGTAYSSADGFPHTNAINPNDNDTSLGTGYEIGGAYPGIAFAGEIDEIRIIKGTAAWTSSFTAPTSPYGPTAVYEKGFPFLNKFQSREVERHANTYELVRRIDKDGETIADPLCPVYWSGSNITGDDILLNSDWDKYVSDLTLNDVLLHRDGPYQHPSWKQIRGVERNDVREMRKTNVISILDKNKQLPEGGLGRSDNTVNYVEPAIAWNKPIVHTVQPLGSTVNANLTSTYSNNLEVFANPWLDSRVSLIKKSNQMYDLLHKEYTKTGSIKLIDYDYSEYIFPKHNLVTLSRVRDRSTYSETAGTGSKGYDRRSSQIRTFWRNKPLDRQRTLYSTSNHYASALNALGARARNSSLWALDYFKYMPSGSWCESGATVSRNDVELVMRGDLAWAGFSQNRGFIYETGSMLTGVTEPSGGGTEEERKAVIAPRPTLQFIHNPNSTMAREEGWAWKAGELWVNPNTASAHKTNAPWEDTYEEYGQDVRLIGQNYALIPEYKVSEHMDYYINQNAGDFLTENKGMFDLPGSVDMSTTLSRENFFAPTNNPTLAVVDYTFEENKATGYEKFSKGYMHNTTHRDISKICIQEPAADIDSSDTNWKCTKDYPVVLLNASGSSTFIKDYQLDGETTAVTDKYLITKSKDQWMSSALAPKITASSFKLSASRTLYDDLEGMPVGCGPISTTSGSFNYWDSTYDWDQWENTFLMSFWVNLDQDAVTAHGDNDIGCISLYAEKKSHKLLPQDIFGLPDEVTTDIYSSFTTNTSSYITNLAKHSRREDGRSGRYLLNSAHVTHAPASKGDDTARNRRIIKNFERYSEPVYPKDTIEQANFYLSDSSDTNKRACWVDSIGNKVYFNASHTKALGSEADNLPALQPGKWNHVSILYVGGSATANASPMTYDSRHHRVFLWVNNRLISSEVPSGLTSTYSAVNANHPTNGTLHMGAGAAGTRQIKSFGGTLAGNFTFGKCQGSILPTDRSLSYTMPAAVLPGKVTDLAIFQGGEVGLVADPTDPDAFDETSAHDLVTLPSKWSWIFNNTNTFASISSMKSSLVTKLFNSQCVDVNTAYQSWRTDFLNDPDNPTTMEIATADTHSEVANQQSDTSIQRSTATAKNVSDLIAYYEMGIPYWKNSSEVKILSDDFFDCFMYTDDIKHLDKMVNDHKDYSQTFKLEVDTVKKLLPYNGFYPSQRAVQLGSMFYDSITPNIAGVSSDTSPNAKARTEQAALQPFFAPGILFNTIKSGIAVDWATYKGDYGTVSVDMRDRFLGDYNDKSITDSAINSFVTDSLGNANPFGETIVEMARRNIDNRIGMGLLDESRREQALLQELERAKQQLKDTAKALQRSTKSGCSERDFQEWTTKMGLLPSDPAAADLFEHMECPDFTQRRGLINKLSTKYGSLLNKIQKTVSITSSPDQLNSIAGYIIQEIDRIPNVFRSSNLTKNYSELDLEGTYLDAAPNLRIPFEGLISLSGVPSTYSQGDKHKIFYLSPSNYLERFETITLLEDQDDENNYNNLRYPYFEWTGKKEVLYELAMHNFLAEIPNFFLKDGELSSFLSASEDRFKTVEVGKTYYMDVDLYKTENFDMTISPHDGETVKVTRGLDANAVGLVDAEGNPYTTHGRYYGPALRAKSNAKMKDDGFYIEDPAQAPYTPPYFYGTAKARLAFRPTRAGKPTLAEIQANTTIEYINEGMDDKFKSKSTNSENTTSWKNTPAYQGRMPIESSINFFGIKNVKDSTYDADGKAISATDANKSSWVIATKFECPTLNFNTAANKETRVYKNALGEIVANLDHGEAGCRTDDERNLYGPVSRDPRGTGIWSGYGKIPSSSKEGIFMELKESFNFNDFSQEELEKRKRYVMSLGIASLTKNIHGNTIVLVSPTGAEEVITIGQPDINASDITPAESASEKQAAVWRMREGERLFSPGAKIRTKHTSVLLGDQFGEAAPNIPNWAGKGVGETYDIQGYFGKEHWISNPLSVIPSNDLPAVPKSYDIANAICYYINYRAFSDRNFKWKATVRNILTQHLNEAVGVSSTNRLSDKNLLLPSNVGAVVEVEWTGSVTTDSKLPSVVLEPYKTSEYASNKGIAALTKHDTFDRGKGNEYKFYEKVEVDGAKFSPATVGSLIDLCGFQTNTTRIGDLSGSKKLQEAIVMIPFVKREISENNKVDHGFAPTVEIDGRNLFKVSESLLNNKNASETVRNTIVGMQKYNIPPMYDYMTNDSVDPFVMYMFEFTEELNQQDLSDIWQGLMPRCARKATKETQTIEHPMDEVNFFEGKRLPKSDNEIEWMIFKVKRKANNNYFKATPDTKDDNLFKFTIGTRKEAVPEYSYNWPYDHCSLVEMARVKGGVSLQPISQAQPTQTPPLRFFQQTGAITTNEASEDEQSTQAPQLTFFQQGGRAITTSEDDE